MRFIASAVLIAALLLRVAPARAETDRVGSYQVQPAVDLLSRVGILSGDPGGSMRLRDTITRAEMAKLVVTALGQGAAAVQARSEPAPFADVKEHWAQGHVAVAKRLGIISGYADGTFRPGAVVTNAEAITMLLRAAGLAPAGTWPQSYLTAARNAGVLTESLQAALPWDGEATRGAAFLLAERAFTMVTDSQGATLMQRIFGGTGPRITVSAAGVEAGATRLSATTLSIAAPGAVLVQVNGRPAWEGQGGAFTFSAELSVGVNEFFVLAADALGNKTQQRITVERR